MSGSAVEKLKYLPASFFGMIMGLTGFSIAVLKVDAFFSVGQLFGLAMIGLSSLLFLVLLSAYLTKVIKYTDAFWEEMKHPVKMNFVPAISISLILLSIAYHSVGLDAVAQWFWTIGAILHITLTLWVLYNWIHHDFFQIEHSNPAWFIPIVGNILVPISGVHYAPEDVSWFFFAIGIVFWPVLFAILLNRIVFHTAIAERLIPTLFIFIAPPAVGFISYVTLNGGEVDSFAKILYFFGLFTTLLMAVSVGKFVKLNFALSWWAYTFPLAAMSIASFLMGAATSQLFYAYIGVFILSLLTIMITLFLVKTVKAVAAGKVCTADH
ncbi:SLAC1 anion channel family protein [Thiomicrorhabdus aquaedulcis]|uniref:SLAC1 anion channel family protein n=1 Tax=Thiomicrorhabdus aquaedulcis TaxID=2211106 RepID=UPI000FD85113|nr:SLAC1 anion channel family protein [Thiomicrorhabdus aquaedulcis]